MIGFFLLKVGAVKTEGVMLDSPQNDFFPHGRPSPSTKHFRRAQVECLPVRGAVD
jgi:hypothetical protein